MDEGGGLSRRRKEKNPEGEGKDGSGGDGGNLILCCTDVKMR